MEAGKSRDWQRGWDLGAGRSWEDQGPSERKPGRRPALWHRGTGHGEGRSMVERGGAQRPGREGVWPALPHRGPASPSLSACPFAGDRQAAIGRGARQQCRQAPLGIWPTWRGKTQIHTALGHCAQPSLLAMSHSRHRAEAPPLEREDSGTFRSALGRRGRRPKTGGQWGRGGEPAVGLHSG